MRLILICLMLFSMKLQAAPSEDVERIIVPLATEKKLMPLYLAPFYKENPGLDDSYMRKLHALMTFDFGFNGVTHVVGNEPDLDQLLQKHPYESGGELETWKKRGISFIVKARVRDHAFDIRVISVATGAVRGVDGMPLTGDLSHDRRQVHRLADAAHKLLFGEEGIASTRILFSKRLPGKEKNKWESEVWEMDYDGGNARQITHNSGYSVTPIYIPPPAGKKPAGIFYVSYKTGQPKIYAASLHDGVGRRLTTLRGNQLLPAVSRQNDKLAFISDFTGNPDLFLQPLDGTAQAVGKPHQIYASFRGTQGSPSFSPDGTKVAFVSNKEGAPKIYVMDIPKAGTRMSQIKPVLLTKYQRSSTAPSWSPDGSKIAFTAKTKGVRQIWMYDFNKREEIQLTTGPIHKENPSWAPNSAHLAYNTVTKDGSDIYIMNLNVAKPVRISSVSNQDRFPNWEP